MLDLCDDCLSPRRYAVGVFQNQKKQFTMPIMYRVSVFRGVIEPIEVQKTTIHTVSYIVEKRSVTERKTTEHFSWHSAKEDAKSWLIALYQRKIDSAKKQIERNKSLIKKVKCQ
jgi:hypothetical protein